MLTLHIERFLTYHGQQLPKTTETRKCIYTKSVELYRWNVRRKFAKLGSTMIVPLLFCGEVKVLKRYLNINTFSRCIYGKCIFTSEVKYYDTLPGKCVLLDLLLKKNWIVFTVGVMCNPQGALVEVCKSVKPRNDKLSTFAILFFYCGPSGKILSGYRTFEPWRGNYSLQHWLTLIQSSKNNFLTCKPWQVEQTYLTLSEKGPERTWCCWNEIQLLLANPSTNECAFWGFTC